MADTFLLVSWLLLVNGLPPFIALLLHDRFNHPVDNQIRWWMDGRPVFGPHKTIRGLIGAILGGAATGSLIGLDIFWAGGLAFAAMAGDLLSSFIKRRRDLQSGADSIILDQLFEGLFPLWIFNLNTPLSLVQNVLTLSLFILLATLSSKIWRFITERPLPDHYPRVVSSTVRFKEWRSCHTPLARYQVWFNLTSFLSDQVMLTWLFKITGLYTPGRLNALELEPSEIDLDFTDLPESFDGFRILLLTDLHLDGTPGLNDRLIAIVKETRPDLCLVGGDFRMKTYGDFQPALDELERTMASINCPFGTFGVLGNHDCIEMLPVIEDTGLVMLVNDAIRLERGSQSLWIAGVDDPHYYRLADTRQAMAEIPDDSFTIFLAHSPESYKEAEEQGAQLYLCGHTHGGQICLAHGVPIITNSRAPRITASGHWRYRKMQGYTSRGVGPSSIPVRFNCPGEVVCITLHRQ